MSKLDDKDLSKIAAGGGPISEVAPGDSGDPPAEQESKDGGGGGGGGGGIGPEGQPPAGGSNQDIGQG